MASRPAGQTLKPQPTQYNMTDPTFRLLAAAAAELYLITRQKPYNSPLRLLGPSDLRLMRLPGRKLRKRREKRLALPEHASAA